MLLWIDTHNLMQTEGSSMCLRGQLMIGCRELRGLLHLLWHLLLIFAIVAVTSFAAIDLRRLLLEPDVMDLSTLMVICCISTK